MIGLKRGTVTLLPHDPAWEVEAARTCARLNALLKPLLGDNLVGIEHVGSTSIRGISAKPILDIAVALRDLDVLDNCLPLLEENGFFHRPQDQPDQRLLVCGDLEADTRTHHIHVVRADGMAWIHYRNFRDYLNEFPERAAEYNALKTRLAAEFANDRNAYTAGKADFIRFTLRKALVHFYLGKQFTVHVDRPLGYVHRKSDPNLVYPINYGYVPGVLGGDDEELDVYLLGIDRPVEQAEVRVIAVVHRANDVEDKLVAAPDGMHFSASEIVDSIRFQEQYYDSSVEALPT
jgi:GrpB-like predicted nucleotidyltransferase (UPF0157 family)